MNAVNIYPVKAEVIIRMIFEIKRLIPRPWNKYDTKSLYEYAKDPDEDLLAEWEHRHDRER